jgi:AcrR family transcriptional regulator
VSPPDKTKSRERLVQVAAALFYQHGIHRTSVDTLVEEAGLSKPTFYNHFRSKAALVTAVMELRSRNWHAAIDSRVNAARTPRTKVMAILDFLETFIEDTGGQPFRGCALVNATIEIPNPADPGREVARRNKRKNRERLEQLARDAGLRDPKGLAASLSLLFEGAIVSAYVEGNPDAARVARRTAERLIRLHRS